MIQIKDQSSGNVAFTATKKLEGGTLQEGQFSFSAHDCNGNLVANATNDKDGNIAFPQLQLDTPGIYRYYIQEDLLVTGSIKNDDTVFQAKVIVRDDGSTQIDYPDGEPVFTNIEQGEPGGDTVDPPFIGTGCGTVIHIDTVNIDTVNFFGCQGGNNPPEGTIPTVPMVPKSVCSGSKNMPDPDSKDFVVPAEGWILCHESPKSYEFETLTIAPGGFIRAVCTALTIKADRLVIQENTLMRMAEPYHIEVLGDYGDPGDTGTAGNIGATGSEGEASGCNYGTQKAPTVGGTGKVGGLGGNGSMGRPGRPNLPADFYFGDIQSDGPVIIFTQSGGGGKGGTGGRGGQGGTGGRGGDEKYCWATCVYNPRDGGDGGQGGQGGDGGQGGQGTNGLDTYVYVKTGQESKITPVKALAMPGDGGDPGQGGLAGYGGEGGERKCANVTLRKYGRRGSDGSVGATGKPGLAGTVQGSPGNVYVIGSDTPLNPQSTQAFSRKVR